MDIDLIELASHPILGTPLWGWVVFLLAWLCFYIAVSTVLHGAKKRVEALAVRRQEQEAQEKGKTAEEAEHNPYRLLYLILNRTTRLSLWGVALILAAIVVPGLPERFSDTTMKLGLVLLILQAGLWAMACLDGILQRVLTIFHIRESSAQTAMGVIRFFAILLLWASIMMLILANVGVQIGPLIAGLGIGGLAIAFALQKILEDLFCSVAIVLDRPFEVGDFVIMGEVLGTIEKIGIKTTRIRSLGGEQIIVSNRDLTNSRIRNYKRMPQRRVVFTFGVLYQTPVEKAEKIGGWLREIIEGIELTRFDRAHLKEFGDSSYNYEVVYFVLKPDYNIYMDVQQAINLAMIRKFKQEGVEFAYPTRTLYLEGMPPVVLEGGNGRAAEPAQARHGGDREP